MIASHSTRLPSQRYLEEFTMLVMECSESVGFPVTPIRTSFPLVWVLLPPLNR